MKTKIILLLSIVMFSFACKSTKSTEKTAATSNTYRLIVSFISKGEGTGSNAAALESLITSFNKKNNIVIKYEKVPWGKEGEADYCFKMDGIKKGKQADFVTSVKNLTKSAPQVIVSENAVCTHKK